MPESLLTSTARVMPPPAKQPRCTLHSKPANCTLTVGFAKATLPAAAHGLNHMHAARQHQPKAIHSEVNTNTLRTPILAPSLQRLDANHSADMRKPTPTKQAKTPEDPSNACTLSQKPVQWQPAPNPMHAPLGLVRRGGGGSCPPSMDAARQSATPEPCRGNQSDPLPPSRAMATNSGKPT